MSVTIDRAFETDEERKQYMLNCHNPWSPLIVSCIVPFVLVASAVVFGDKLSSHFWVLVTLPVMLGLRQFQHIGLRWKNTLRCMRLTLTDDLVCIDEVFGDGNTKYEVAIYKLRDIKRVTREQGRLLLHTNVLLGITAKNDLRLSPDQQDALTKWLGARGFSAQSQKEVSGSA